MATNRTLQWGFVPLFAILLSFPVRIGAQSSIDSQQRFERAVAQISQNNYEQAIPALQAIITRDPKFSKAYRILAEASIFVNKHDEARAFFQNVVESTPKNAYAHYALGRFDIADKKYELAIAHLKTAIELDPTFVDTYGYRGGLPEVYKAKQDLDTGILFFTERIDADPENACSYYGLARCYIHKYQWQEALSRLSKTLQLDPEFTIAYQSILHILIRTSQYEKAIQTGRELLRISEALSDKDMMSYGNMAIGNASFFRGDYHNAAKHYNLASKQAQELGDKGRQATCVNNMAAVYAMSANFPKALYYFKESLSLARKMDNEQGTVQALNNIANVYKDQGDDEDAHSFYEQALAGARKSGLKYEESLALANMAEIFQKRGEYPHASDFLSRALAIAEATDDKGLQGYVLRSLGTLYQIMGRDSLAIRNLNRALEIGLATNDTQVLWETEAALGSCYQEQGKPNAAVQHYSRAVAIYDSVRSTLDIESLSNNFLEDKYGAYPSLVQLLGESGDYVRAFEYAEKYKAKALLDIVSQGRNVMSILQVDTLQTQLRQITTQLEETHRQLFRQLASSDKKQTKVLALEQEVTDLELRKAEVIAHAKQRHAGLFQLTAPAILKPEDIQSQVLEENQAILEYVVGAEGISLLVVTPDSVGYSFLPINSADLHDLMAALSPVFESDATSLRKTSGSILDAQSVNFTVPPAHALYEALIKPAEDWIGNCKELIIIPDDILFYLPFEMLVYDTTGAQTRYDFESVKFLLQKYVISYASSASLLDPALQRPRHPKKGILAMGNPDLGQPEQPQSDALIAFKDVLPGHLRDQALLSLPKSALEVEAIGKVLSNSDNRIFTGADATEHIFKSEAADYRIIHLATHFISDDNQPLYSSIVLSIDNEEREDGYLQTHEVFNLDLNADLAVLSACETGLGKLRKGEGLIGISRAFLFAGTPSLVVSLWSVDDESTAQIMEHFYENLKKGLRKNEALRRAKLDYLKFANSLGRDPYYWAPFVLLGSSDPVRMSASPNWGLPLGLILVLALVVGFILRKRDRFSRS